MIPMTAELAAAINEVEKLGPIRGDASQVSREVGEFLAAIAVAVNARTIVEIGTSYGFSGLWWSAALARTGGHLHTIDISEKKYSAAKQAFTTAGVAARVTSYLGAAQEILPTLPAEMDVVFIDADKAATKGYFDALWPRVRVGGCVVTDNVLSHQEEMAGYLAHLRSRNDAHTVTVPMRAGVEWTMKLTGNMAKH